MSRQPRGFYARYGKRTLDILIAALILLVLALPLLLVAVLIALDSRGPVLFLQERVGLLGRTFKVYKFRTMTNRARKVVQVHDGDPEVTRIGGLLRRLKVDEMPQFLNVLLGQMSLVGPRPTVESSLDHSNPDADARALVRPGITGLAQVSGGILLTWPQRWRYDAEYVRRLTLWLDLAILARTVLVVVRGDRPFFKLPGAAR